MVCNYGNLLLAHEKHHDVVEWYESLVSNEIAIGRREHGIVIAACLAIGTPESYAKAKEFTDRIKASEEAR